MDTRCYHSWPRLFALLDLDEDLSNEKALGQQTYMIRASNASCEKLGRGI